MKRDRRRWSRPPGGWTARLHRRTAVTAGLVTAAGVSVASAAATGVDVPGSGGADDGSAAPTYYVYVANESSDMVSQVAFTPGEGARVVRETSVGMSLTELDAPHGLAVSPDGEHWYVSLAHGVPYGHVWKYRTGSDELVGRVQLGRFPATMGLSPDGEFLFVVNFNLHGEMVPSDVSVVHAETMAEIARPQTCLMPHGSRVSASGAKQYSACMHSDQVVEIDTRTFEVTSRFSVSPGREGALPLHDTGEQGHDEHAGHGSEMAPAEACSPTWAQPAAGDRADRFVYVPCNKRGEILEIDVSNGAVTRRWDAEGGPYNLEVSPDGRLLLITLKGAQGVGILDLAEGKEVARIETSQPITHGVVISPDGRYAFVTNEAIGSTLGTVDVIDLQSYERVDSVEVRHQPGGIDFWKIEEG